MTDRDGIGGPRPPCGFGIFNEEGLLVAFPSDGKARDVLQACEQEGHQTAHLKMQPVFTVPPEQDARLAALEAELQQTRLALAAVTQQRNEIYGELIELRAALRTN